MNEPPLVVSYGGGTNSTALLIGYVEKGIRPDLIMFSDTGGEFQRTYDYIYMFSDWLKKQGMPRIVWVNNAHREGFPHRSLEDECINNKTLPSLAFGFKGCSVKWKRQPMDRYIRDNFQPAKEAWEAGLKVRRAIGIDAGEPQRGKIPDDKKFTYEFPLMEWDWARDECLAAIERANLPMAGKSACWYCPASKRHEVVQLANDHPDLFERAVTMEENALLTTIKGLSRQRSWKEIVEADRQQLKLPFDEIAPDMDCMCFDGEADD